MRSIMSAKFEAPVTAGGMPPTYLRLHFRPGPWSIAGTGPSISHVGSGNLNQKVRAQSVRGPRFDQSRSLRLVAETLPSRPVSSSYSTLSFS